MKALASEQKLSIPDDLSPLHLSSIGKGDQPDSVEVPDYSLIRELGGGAYGNVWIARNHYDEALRALKILKRDAEIEIKGLRDFKDCSEVRHDHLIEIYHVGRTVSGVYYYVMPLADDINSPSGMINLEHYKPNILSKFIARRRLSIREALELARELLAGLQVIHKAGAIHRDLKPANVLKRASKWCIGDPGLLIKGRSSGDIGTPGFIPPEGCADHTADIYALGKIIFLAGISHKLDEFNALEARELELPALGPLGLEFTHLVLKACAREPSQRFRSAAEMNQEVTAMLEGDTGVGIQRYMGAETDEEEWKWEEEPTTEIWISEEQKLPERIGNYEILDRIGRGGIGQVYLARRIGDHEQVALKVPLLEKGLALDRFESECDHIARIDHPHVVSFVDRGSRNDPYLVMEYVPGKNIIEYSSTNRLTLAQRLVLFSSVCEVIQHLHHMGITHRDIKPSHILVPDARREVKLCGFALSVSDNTPLDRQGAICGTIPYMAPEQVEGDPARIGRSTDVYQLGSVLHELVTGIMARDVGPTGFNEVLDRIRNENLPLPSKRFHDAGREYMQDYSASLSISPRRLLTFLKRDLDHIIIKAMNRTAASRYESALALEQDIARFIAGKPITAKSHILGGASAWLRRRPT